MAIDDYNKIFKTNFDTSGKGFQDYYKDLSDKVKKREVDLLIVVNMFLTGFDATTLNTLWVDKESENAWPDTGIFQNQPHTELCQNLWQYCLLS